MVRKFGNAGENGGGHRIKTIKRWRGYYTVPQASGEAYVFSQIVSLSDRGDGTYAAVVNVFVAGSGFTGNPHGTINEWKASGYVPEVRAKMDVI